MKVSLRIPLLFAATVWLSPLLVPTTQIISPGQPTQVFHNASLRSTAYSRTSRTLGRPGLAQTTDYKTQYPQEYAFFKAAFDQANKNLYPAERDSAFFIFAQNVEALQKSGAKITLGGMLSLLIW